MKRIIWKSLCMAGIMSIAALLAWDGSMANAQSSYCGGWGGGWGINFPYGLYGSRVEEVPYFSMFPPVYYSLPVPRTYGWSPFAYPPGTMTPEVTIDQPQEIINPYVPQNKDAKPAKPTSARTAGYRAHTPQLLINRFVSGDGAASSASMQIAGK